jgi:DNA-binding MarR family transcriptional regulator
MSYMGEYEKFVERLAQDLASALRRRMYRAQFERMLGLRSSSEKLVYFYLVESQPQSFTTMRKSLGISKATLSRALQRLRGWRLVALDERFLYWIERQDDR